MEPLNGSDVRESRKRNQTIARRTFDTRRELQVGTRHYGEPRDPAAPNVRRDAIWATGSTTRDVKDVARSQSGVVRRCEWAAGDPALIRYHDNEWGIPEHDDRRLFEFLVLEGAQAGLSWLTVLKKRGNYRSRFDNFDPKRVARYDTRKVRALLADEGITRNRLKISSAIKNARAVLNVQKDFGTFDSYIWGFVGGQRKENRWRTLRQIPARTKESDAMSDALKKRGFTFVGSTICYAYMQAVGLVNDHVIHCFRHDA